ncbi:MAG: tRNA glutamyl-Q(34) synthetase GluQRS [Rhizobiaceae bacterium]|nr:tRNA glutamyl-Q(34) synthetase GluQRS [Rhizobiaceae bacterium]
MQQPVFRFAPTPNGYLHLGHAYAALYNQKICKAHQGTMLLRMENTDIGRCSTQYEDAILEDLEWIGFKWQGDIRRQSEHFDYYRSILDGLEARGLVYPAFLSRNQVKKQIEDWQQKNGETWPRDPDGGVHYPGNDRKLEEINRAELRLENPNFARRLDIEAAQNSLDRDKADNLSWQEVECDDEGAGAKTTTIKCELGRWGDVVMGRLEIPASYHLACVIDDGIQGITHVVRGEDMEPSTSIHRLLQEVLEIDEPVYCHHALIVDENGVKYSKRYGDTGLRELREAGMKPEDIHQKIGIQP